LESQFALAALAMLGYGQQEAVDPRDGPVASVC